MVGFIRLKSSCFVPFNIQIFSLDSLFLDIVVVEVNESIVNEIELIAGIFNPESTLPQYFISAKFGWAIAVTSDNLILREKLTTLIR